jgi:hypothetical protein
MLIKDSYSSIVAAALILHIINKRSFISVFKDNPHKTEAAGKAGILLLHNLSLPPDGILYMCHLVTDFQIQSPPHTYNYTMSGLKNISVPEIYELLKRGEYFPN